MWHTFHTHSKSESCAFSLPRCQDAFQVWRYPLRRVVHVLPAPGMFFGAFFCPARRAKQFAPNSNIQHSYRSGETGKPSEKEV